MIITIRSGTHPKLKTLNAETSREPTIHHSSMTFILTESMNDET